MGITILDVARGSLAARLGIQPGETLLTINGEPVLDEIDYQALTTVPRLKLTLRDARGEEHVLSLRKPASAPLGLKLDERIILEPRVCRNHCVFCFVDQMPPGMRKTLYVKDDDWRLSLMMGNFVTLTNVDEAEFQRILRRKASPLYISVHATDPDTRIRMLRNPNAGKIMEQLTRLKEAGIRFHCQVVLCPGENDGDILFQTIVDLAGLYPATQSLAIVPIGLTDHREGLYPLRLFRREEAKKLLQDLELIEAHYLKTLGTRFLFPADELYSIAGLPVPSEECYEGYPQIENGIGMIRQLTEECEEAWQRLRDKLETRPLQATRHVLIPTGVSALPYIQPLAARYAPPGTSVEVFAVPNRFFGPSVTVTGLIVGADLVEALHGRHGDQVLISCAMLRENADCFLDDWTVAQVIETVGMPIRVVQHSGEDFIRALWQAEERTAAE
ncbi:MAG: DUF512 domain-containing protein [Clostridia bacterium]|nr:DUF512 domain-containing protein [Clostridia bacterium]